MRRLRRPCLILCVIALEAEPSSTDARADEAPPRPDEYGGCDAHQHCHDGFYARATAGVGYSAFLPKEPFDLSKTGWGTSELTMSVGGALAPGFVGGAFLGASFARNFSSSRAGAFVDWYPLPRRGFHGGFGAGAWRITSPDPASAPDDVALTLGAVLTAGYDAWFEPSWSAGVLASVAVLPPTTFEESIGRSVQLTPTQYALGLDVLFQ